MSRLRKIAMALEQVFAMTKGVVGIAIDVKVRVTPDCKRIRTKKTRASVLRVLAFFA